MSDTLLSMPHDDPAPDLNPLLDRARLAETFKRSGRVQIPNVLTNASAHRLHHALEHETRWGLFFNEGDKRREFESVSSEDHQEMAIAAWDRAHSGQFQYFYHYCQLLFNNKIYVSSEHCLFNLTTLLTAPHFLVFIREVTGMNLSGWPSADATLYKPLDFLTLHTDANRRKNRLVAYSLNMSPGWRPDWGGALQFYDGSGRIEESYLPAFNTLNLFRVPKPHSVTQVSVFGGFRYSVSGWFYGNSDQDAADNS